MASFLNKILILKTHAGMPERPNGIEFGRGARRPYSSLVKVTKPKAYEVLKMSHLLA